VADGQARVAAAVQQLVKFFLFSLLPLRGWPLDVFMDFLLVWVNVDRAAFAASAVGPSPADPAREPFRASTGIPCFGAGFVGCEYLLPWFFVGVKRNYRSRPFLL
jgi:hypothetical protein